MSWRDEEYDRNTRWAKRQSWTSDNGGISDVVSAKEYNNNNRPYSDRSETKPPPDYSHSQVQSARPKKRKMVGSKLIREFLAEMLGTFLLVLFGDGAIAQVVIGGKLKPDGFFSNFQSICFGYGFALMIGILVSGGVSGGHLNPAVTLAMAAIRKLKWIQVPIYMIAQYLGAFLAAAVLMGIYADGINEMEAILNNSTEKTIATAGIFASYPGGEHISTITLALDQILGTALLLIIILAVTDEKNMNVASGLVPLLIGLGLAAIHISFGLNAGCAINPARDFSPRLVTLIGGWGSDPFKANDSFFWIPWILPHIGSVLGALLYQFMVALHHPDDD